MRRYSHDGTTLQAKQQSVKQCAKYFLSELWAAFLNAVLCEDVFDQKFKNASQWIEMGSLRSFNIITEVDYRVGVNISYCRRVEMN